MMVNFSIFYKVHPLSTNKSKTLDRDWVKFSNGAENTTDDHFENSMKIGMLRFVLYDRNRFLRQKVIQISLLKTAYFAPNGS